MAYRNILVEQDGTTAVVALNRPERRNALSLEMLQELTAAFRALGPEARVVVLRGNGPAFSAGHDLAEMQARDPAFYRQLFEACTTLMECLQDLAQPVIAQVHGIATAAGCQLVCSCDLAIASENASFATPGVKIGLFCTTPMVALTRAVGRKRALEMLLTGRMVDAPTAADWGIVNRVVPADELAPATAALAREIASASDLTLGIGKQAFYSQIDLDQPKAYAYAKEVMSMNSLAADAQEGITAFLEKRPACWRGR